MNRLLVILPVCWALTTPAAAQQQRSRRFRGPCASVDPGYQRLADATGGQVFRLRDFDRDNLGAVMEARLADSRATILLATGNLPAGGTREVSFPVDSTVTKLIVSVTMACMGPVQVLRPGGVEVDQGGGPGITSTNLSAGRIVTVRSPEAGFWRVRVSGAGHFSVDVRADSPIALDRFDFVRPGGRPGHEGLFRIHGQPVVGDLHTARAGLDGPFQTAQLKLISDAGELMQYLKLSPVDTVGRELVGPVDLPEQRFRAALEGIDERGLPFQRVVPQLFQVQSVQLAVESIPESVEAGAAVVVGFVVRNFGAAATFRVVITDASGWRKAPYSRVVRLGSREEIPVQIRLTVPAGTAPGTEVLVVATATNAVREEESNSGMATLRVGER